MCRPACSPNIIFSRTNKSALKLNDHINSLYGHDVSLPRLIVSRKAALNGFFSSDKPKGYISELSYCRVLFYEQLFWLPSVPFDITFSYDNINGYIGKRLRNVKYFTHAQFQMFTYPFIVYIPTGVNDRLTIANCLYYLTE